MIKLFLFCLGLFLASLGLFFLIIYLNLFSMGYTFLEFVKFILMRAECYLLIVGVFLIIISLGRTRKK